MLFLSKNKNTLVQIFSIVAYRLKASRVRANKSPIKMKIMILETSVKFMDIRASGNK